jgi:hypothetical protein
MGYQGLEEAEFNPYAAPRSDGRELTPYYRVVSQKIRYAEYWRITPNVVSFLVLAAFKTLRVPFPFRSAIHYPERLTLVDTDQIPPHVHELWRAPLDALERLGYRSALCYTTPALGVNKEILVLILLPPDGLISVTLIYHRTQVVSKINEVVTIASSSRLADGRWAGTRNSRAFFDGAPDVIIQVVPGGNVEQVIAKHRDWLASMGATLVPIAEESLAKVTLERERIAIENLIERGAFARMTEREVEAYARQSQATETPPPSPADRRYLGGLRRIGQVFLVATFISLSLLITQPAQRQNFLSDMASLTLALCSVGIFVIMLLYCGRIETMKRRR